MPLILVKISQRQLYNKVHLHVWYYPILVSRIYYTTEGQKTEVYGDV